MATTHAGCVRSQERLIPPLAPVCAWTSFLLDFLEISGSIPAFKRHAGDLPALDTEGYRRSFEFGDRKCRLVYGDESEVVPPGRTTGEASVSHRKLHFEVFRLISSLIALQSLAVHLIVGHRWLRACLLEHRDDLGLLLPGGRRQRGRQGRRRNAAFVKRDL